MLKKKAPDEKEVRQKLVDRPAPNRGTPAGGPNPFSSASTSTSNSGADLLEERKDSILFQEAEQDALLIDMEAALQRLKGTSLTINKELHEQGDLVLELKESTLDSESRMTRVELKVDTLLKRTGCPYYKIIIVLTIIFLILLFLIIEL